MEDQNLRWILSSLEVGVAPGSEKTPELRARLHLELSESASGQLSARILDKVPAKVTRSGNGVKFRLQHPGCDYAELYFNFSNGRPVNGGYDIVGTGPDCGRGGSYTFP